MWLTIAEMSIIIHIFCSHQDFTLNFFVDILSEIFFY